MIQRSHISTPNCHQENLQLRQRDVSVPNAEASSSSIGALSSFECDELIIHGVELNNIGKLSLDRQERQITWSLLSHTWPKVRPGDIPFRNASLTRGHSHAHCEECLERHEQVQNRYIVFSFHHPRKEIECISDPRRPSCVTFVAPGKVVVSLRSSS